MKNYRLWGTPPYNVAVAHGGPGAAGEMAAVADELSKTAGVLEPLQTADSVRGQAEELRDVLEEHVNLPVVLIGHSWGAWLSFIATARYPGLVKKLILVASGPFEARYAAGIDAERLVRLSEPDRIDFLKMVEIINCPDVRDKDESLARFGALAAKADTYDALPAKRYDAPEGLGVSAEINRKVMVEALKLRESGKLLSLGKEITCPVVAIHGDYDTHPAEGVKKPLSRVLRDFRFILLEKCGHEPWLERYARDEFFRVLREEIAWPAESTSNGDGAAMIERVVFSDREKFREWLNKNHNVSKGVWLVFSKVDGFKTLKPGEALEEALCFGWIDGQIKSLGDEKYLKKFTPRTKDSKWSEVNKALANRLIESGRMTEHGLAAIEQAKSQGAWDAPPRERVPDDQIEVLVNALQGSDLALANFLKMPLSVRRTYTAFYLDAKKEETRIRRLERIIGRLNANKVPM